MPLKLWILRPIDTESEGSPWNPWYDKAFGFVVAAHTEDEARKLAQEKAGYEKWAFRRTDKADEQPLVVWLDHSLASCDPLEPGNEPKVIMMDFHAA